MDEHLDSLLVSDTDLDFVVDRWQRGLIDPRLAGYERARKCCLPSPGTQGGLSTKGRGADDNCDGVLGHRQITDAYLVAPGKAKGGRLVTLDRGIAALHADVELLVP